MIVKCSKCQTKFKVADEQISGQGTTVRCSKCQHTFQVKRSVAAPVADPFAMLDDLPPAATPAKSSSLADQLFGDLAQSEFDAESVPAQLPPPLPSEGPDHSLFEMPPVLPPQPELAPMPRELLPPEEALLPPAPPKSRLLGTQAFLQPSKESRQTQPRSKLKTLVTGLVVNIAIAAGLVLVLCAVGTIYANDGKLDPSAFSIRRIGALIKANREALAVESWNGMYDTKAGKPVFYIRGEAQNTGGASSKLRVRAEILDGAQLVRSAEVLAGAAAGPEDLYNIGSSEDAEALNARLESAATAVAPGRRAPFSLTFYDYPPNLWAFRLKVTVRPLSTKETAAR
jgi:predicted Zn finger-like uncharacterized protein